VEDQKTDLATVKVGDIVRTRNLPDGPGTWYQGLEEMEHALMCANLSPSVADVHAALFEQMEGDTVYLWGGSFWMDGFCELLAIY